MAKVVGEIDTQNPFLDSHPRAFRPTDAIAVALIASLAIAGGAAVSFLFG